MANYNSLKNAAILAPASNTDLGSPTNKYGNLYMSGNISLNGTSLNSTNAIAPRVTSISYPGDDTAANPAGGQTITLTGSGFVTGANVLINGSVANSASVVDSSTLTFTSPTLSAGSYVLYVINADGSTAISIPGIQYSGVPAWTTSAGSLGSPVKASSVSYTVAATGDAPITYSVYSGALPSGLSLNSTSGVISGTTPTVSNATTYNFTIRATDAQKQDTDRAFSLTVTVVNPTPSVSYLIVAGGGAGGNHSGAGGGGVVYSSAPLNISTGQSYTITVGAVGGDSAAFGATAYAGAASAGQYGQNGGSGSGGGRNGAGTNSGGSSTQISYPALNGVGLGGAGGTGYVGSPSGAGGGGGAGGNGGSYSGGTGGNGGAGYQSSITGTAVYYAGGGGGGGTYTIGTAGSGTGPGSYGGGANGGGGGQQDATPGTVIIRYSNTYDAAASTTGSPTVTNTGGYRIYQWTSSGSITF